MSDIDKAWRAVKRAQAAFEREQLRSKTGWDAKVSAQNKRLDSAVGAYNKLMDKVDKQGYAA